MSYKVPAKTYFDRLERFRHCVADMQKTIHAAVVKYLSSIKDVVSCSAPSDETKGKVCLEEISYSYDKKTNIVTICYSTFDDFGHGELGDEQILEVESSVLDDFVQKEIEDYVNTVLK